MRNKPTSRVRRSAFGSMLLLGVLVLGCRGEASEEIRTLAQDTASPVAAKQEHPEEAAAQSREGTASARPTPSDTPTEVGEELSNPSDETAEQLMAQRSARAQRIDELKKELANNETLDPDVRRELTQLVEAEFRQEVRDRSLALNSAPDFVPPKPKGLSDAQRAELQLQMQRFDMNNPKDVAAYDEVKRQIVEGQ